MASFQSQVQNFDHILQNAILRIPDYQRCFAWGDSQLMDFWNDINCQDEPYLMGAVYLSKTGTQKDRFQTDVQCFEVVDGQQRLTCCAVVLASIRKFLDLSDPLRIDIDNKLFWYDTADRQFSRIQLNHNLADFFRLSLSGITTSLPSNVSIGADPEVIQDAASVSSPLQHTTEDDLEMDMEDLALYREIPAVRLINSAFAFFDERLTTAQSQTFQNDLSGFRTFILHLQNTIRIRVKFSLNIVESAEAAGRLFEVLNNRGVPLSQLDLVKNFLLYMFSKHPDPMHRHGLCHGVLHTWELIFSRFPMMKKSSFDHEVAFLSFVCEGTLSSQTKSKTLIWNLKEICGSNRFHPGEPAAMLSSIESLTKFLRTIQIGLNAFVAFFCAAVGDNEEDLEFRRLFLSSISPLRTEAVQTDEEWSQFQSTLMLWFDKLKRLSRPSLVLPLLISVFCRTVETQSSPSFFIRVMQELERAIFIIYAPGVRNSGTGKKRFASIARKYFEGSRDDTQTLTDLREFVKKTVEKGGYDLFSNFFSKPEHDLSEDFFPLLRYLLFEYEYSLYSSYGANPEQSVLWPSSAFHNKFKYSVEHICPQSAFSSRLEGWEHWNHPNKNVQNLGNLVISRGNVLLSRHPFHQKCSGTISYTYEHSDILMERELTRFRNWTFETAQERSSEIFHFILNRWDYQFSE
eukprot:ANDGO_00614.mRNA.1 hypothetical protein